MEAKLVLLITPVSGVMDWLQAALAGGGWPLLGAPDVSIALARIGGGGVGAVVLHLPGTLDLSAAGWNSLRRLHRQAPQLPVVIMGDSAAQDRRSQALSLGAVDYFVEEEGAETLAARLRRILEPGRAVRTAAEVPQSARVISLLGAKGGVGTTTTALNLASTLARDGSVILAEIRPGAGTLAHLLHPGRAVHTLRDLLDGPPRPVESCLWSTPAIPRLHVLFGPDRAIASSRQQLDEKRISLILRDLARSADYVVLDLEPIASGINRTILAASDYLAMVVEREPISVEAACRMFEAMTDVRPAVTGAVVVNRAALTAPLPLPEVTQALGTAIFEVIPPAPDLCMHAQKSHRTLAQIDPESLVAAAFGNLAMAFERPKERSLAS